MLNHNQLIEKIKINIIPHDFYNYELPNLIFKKNCWTDGGLCPFHSDTKAGSFWVNLATGGFKCFSCGAHGGDVVSFTMLLHNLSFSNAIAKLSSEWGLL